VVHRSAGWMYQLIIGSFLGLKRKGNSLQFEPCIPVSWESFKIQYRFIDTIYHITFLQNNDQPKGIFVDEEMQLNKTVSLVNDEKEHFVKVNIE
jgi:cyclic beta-1,2-glucan synthetase